MTGEDPDADLLRSLANGDVSAMHVLVDRKLSRITALAFRMLGDQTEAEDVGQEALLRVWRHAARWRADGPAKFDTWLHRVVLNLCYDRLRRKRDRPMQEAPEIVDPSMPADLRLEVDESSALVLSALGKLPDRQREAIILHHYQDLSNLEAARVMGISLDALESLLTRGRRGLRTLLRGLGYEH